MSPDYKNLTFLLADDHSLIRQGIVFILEDIAEDCEILHANTLQKAWETIQEQHVDIAVIDAHFPDGNSLTILQDVKKLRPEIKILIYTGIDEKTQSLKFINAGANGFLSKMSEEEEMKQAIIKMIEDGEYISSVTQALLMTSIRDKSLVNPLVCLTEREMQIAEMYAEGYGNLEIANKLNIKQNTVSTLKKRMFDKLKIENLVELIDLIKTYY